MGEIYVFPSKTFNFELFQEIHASTGLLMWVNLLVHKHYVQQDTRSNYFWFDILHTLEFNRKKIIMKMQHLHNMYQKYEALIFTQRIHH